MAGSLIRIATGVGAFVAITAAGGPVTAVAAADPGPRLHSPYSREDDHSVGRRERHPRPGHEALDGSRRRALSRGGHDGRGNGSPTATIANRSDPVVSLAEVAPTSPVSAGRVTPDALLEGPASRPRGSSNRTHVSQAAIPAPRVTVGNGRSPGIPFGRPDAIPDQTQSGTAIVVLSPVTPPPRSPAPAVPSAPPVELLKLPAPAAPPFELVEPQAPMSPVKSFGGTLRPGWPAGILFGIAGLILAPLVGVWLGYREARALKAASPVVER